MIPLPVMIIVGVMGVALVAGLITSYNSGQQAKAQLVQCKANYDGALDKIAEQNTAVENLQKASAEASGRAKAALAKARQGVAANQGERERLAGLQAAEKSNPITICPAGDAVSKIRQGFLQ